MARTSEPTGPQEFFSLLLEADLAELPKARGLMVDVGRRAGLPESRIFDLQVCVSETTANAIEHAASEVEIEAWILPDRVIVEVTNDGVFQPGLVKNEDTRRRGLGLPLVVSLADQVHVSRLETGKTKLSLTFFVPGASDDALTTAAVPTVPQSASPVSRPPLALWFLLGAFVVAVAVLAPLRQKAVYNPAGVFTAANIVFLTLVSLFVSVLAARAYLRDRPPTVLLIGCGTLALGLGALLAAVHAGGPGVNPIPATYNTAALLAGLCYLGAATWARPTSNVRPSLRPWVLSAAFAGIVILLALLVVLVRSGVWPLYFVQGQGQTTVGSAVARTSAFLFAIAALAIMFVPGAVDVGLRRWYGIGLAMIAVGLAAVSLQLALGDPLNWLGRASQYVGCVVILAGLAHSARTGGMWTLPLERALEESERRYRNLVNLSPDGIFVDAEGKHLFANRAAARLLHRGSPEELIGAGTMDNVHPEDRETVAQRIGQIMAGAVAPPREVRMLRADGSIVWTEVTGSRVEFQGRLAVQAVLRDITERKRMEETLRESRERYRSFFDSIEEAHALCAVVSDANGDVEDYQFLEVNPAFERFMRLPRAQVVGKTALTLLPAHVEAVIKRFGEVVSTGQPAHFENYSEALDTWFDLLAYRTGPGQFAYVARDITEAKRAEEALGKSESSLVEAQHIGRIGSWEWNIQTGEINWSAELYSIYQVDPGTFVPSIQSFAGFIHPDDREYVDEIIGQILSGESPGDFDFRIVRADGSIRHLRVTGQITENDEAGRPRLMVGVNQDITERKLAEEALRDSEERFRLMFERHGAVMLLIDPETGAIVDGNTAATRFYGYSRDELIALSIHDLNQLPVEQVAAEYQKAAAEERSHFVFPHVVAGGETRWVDVHSVPIEVQSKNLLFSIIQDITERTRAEEELQRSEEQQSFLLDLSDTVRSLEDPMEIQEVAARALGERLAVDRVFYADVVAEFDHDYLMVERDYHAPGLPEVHGRIPMSLYSDRDNREHRAGRTVWSSDVEADPKVTKGERRAYQVNKTRSYVGVPIIKQLRLVAVLGIVHGAPREWRPDEITFAERAADRIWRELERARAEEAVRESKERYRLLAEENERLYRQQLEIAENVQGAFLHIPSELGPIRLGHLYRSATEQARVGGDFYDVFQAKEGRIALLIGDVSGHGLEAARVATLVKDVVHAFAHQFRRPHLVLRETNRLLVEKNLPGFVTAFLGLLDPETGTLVYSSAGHPPPLLLADGQAEPLMSASLPLGVLGDARYRDLEIDVPKGAGLLLYTDGLTEARRDGNLFGEAGLVAALAKLGGRPIEELPSALLDEALSFSDGGLRDDVALLAICYPGAAARGDGCEERAGRGSGSV